MDDLCQYADRPISFVVRYVRRRPYSHAVIFCCVLAAVGCAVTTQYGVKFLVDSLIDYGQTQQAWLAFFVLIALITGDNLLWRLASWIATTRFRASPATCAATCFGISPGTHQAISWIACLAC